jgi:hypothetical protein
MHDILTIFGVWGALAILAEFGAALPLYSKARVAVGLSLIPLGIAALVTTVVVLIA